MNNIIKTTNGSVIVSSETKITKIELEKQLLQIELLISSIDSPDRRKSLKTKLIEIAEKL